MAKRRLLKALKIIGAILCVLVVLGAGLFAYVIYQASQMWDAMAESDTYAAPGDPLTEKALKDTSVATINGMTLRLVRYHAHPFMAEYRMVLEAIAGDHRSSRELEPDSGGMSTVKLCNNAEGTLLLQDNSSIIEISATGEIKPLDDTSSPKARCSSAVGKFGHGEVGGYGFQPVAP